MKKTFIAAIAGIILATSAAFADPFTKNGNTWTHPSGVTMQVAESAKVESDGRDDSIEISGGGTDDYFIGGHVASSQKDAEARVANLRKALDQAKVKWGKQTNETGPEYANVSSQGSGSLNGSSAEFSLGYYAKDGKFFVFMTTYNVAAKDKLDPMISAMMSSVRFK